MKKVLTTPIKNEDIESLRIGDIVYLDGKIATCRDTGHRRRVLAGIRPDFELAGMAIFHAGPIVQKQADHWQMISIGPTTSMRMEKFEAEFIGSTGVKLIVGKGGMGPKTVKACQEHKVLHAVFPGGCAVLAAEAVERIAAVEWLDLGMPEAFWILQVKNLGPLIISIDTTGNNLFEQNKAEFHRRKEVITAELAEKVRFIK